MEVVPLAASVVTVGGVGGVTVVVVKLTMVPVAKPSPRAHASK